MREYFILYTRDSFLFSFVLSGAPKMLHRQHSSTLFSFKVTQRYFNNSFWKIRNFKLVFITVRYQSIALHLF